MGKGSSEGGPRRRGPAGAASRGARGALTVLLVGLAAGAGCGPPPCERGAPVAALCGAPVTSVYEGRETTRDTVAQLDGCGYLVGVPLPCGLDERCVDGTCVAETAADCGRETSCVDCVRSGLCGMCDGVCVAGSSAGPDTGACTDWAFEPTECVAGGAQVSACQLSDGNCVDPLLHNVQELGSLDRHDGCVPGLERIEAACAADPASDPDRRAAAGDPWCCAPVSAPVADPLTAVRSVATAQFQVAVVTAAGELRVKPTGAAWFHRVTEAIRAFTPRYPTPEEREALGIPTGTTKITPPREPLASGWRLVAGSALVLYAVHDDGRLYFWRSYRVCDDAALASGMPCTNAVHADVVPVVLDRAPRLRALAPATMKGWDRGCGIGETGALWCWTLGGDGLASFERIGAADDWTVVASGGPTTCAIREGGALYCFGARTRASRTSSYDVFDGHTEPEPIGAGEGPWIDVSTDGVRSCGITAAGTLRCWGDRLWSLGLGNAPRSSAEAPPTVRQPARLDLPGGPFVGVHVGTSTCVRAASGVTKCVLRWACVPNTLGAYDCHPTYVSAAPVSWTTLPWGDWETVPTAVHADLDPLPIVVGSGSPWAQWEPPWLLGLRRGGALEVYAEEHFPWSVPAQAYPVDLVVAP